MNKTAVLEAISYKTRRVKFGNNWLPVDPFLTLDDLEFGQTYEAEFKLADGSWYITSFKRPVQA